MEIKPEERFAFQRGY